MSYFNQLKLNSNFLVTPYILITVALLNFNDSYAQSLTRQVISSMGNTQVSTELYLSQTAGQGALVNVSSNEQAELRQGFQQPILLSNGKDRFEIELSIYPNPNNGEFNLATNLPRDEEFELYVYDMNGKLISHHAGLKGQLEYIILPPGIARGNYPLMIRTQNGLTGQTKISIQ